LLVGLKRGKKIKGNSKWGRGEKRGKTGGGGGTKRDWGGRDGEGANLWGMGKDVGEGEEHWSWETMRTREGGGPVKKGPIGGNEIIGTLAKMCEEFGLSPEGGKGEWSWSKGFSVGVDEGVWWWGVG